jgi:hypothetical protein
MGLQNRRGRADIEVMLIFLNEIALKGEGGSN